MSKNNTNYMRSVNDYSLSAHEIFNDATELRFPKDTRVLTANHITTENFNRASEIALKVFQDDGYVKVKDYSINYDDGSDPGEESQYTIYEQAFFVLKKQSFTNDLYDPESTIVLEVYRRNGQIIILTLALASTEQYISKMASLFRSEFKAPPKGKVFYTISQSSHGFELEEMKIPTEYDIHSIDLHYNDDFHAVHETITKYIEEDKKGLILLHGIPGSGKTSYIKQLISKGDKRKLVYIPPHLAGSIAAPQFITFVRDKLKSCVLIIEDAEQILHSRDGGGDSTAVSNLLNISDGILGEALNILIICTFNIDKSHIDKALTRKGRMVAEYYFGELSLDKSIALVKSLYGEDAELSLETSDEGKVRTLANIFNMNFEQHRSPDAKKATTAFGFHPTK